jgi:hypothetical protein
MRMRSWVCVVFCFVLFVFWFCVVFGGENREREKEKESEKDHHSSRDNYHNFKCPTGRWIQDYGWTPEQMKVFE